MQQQQPPGWFPDPEHPDQERYWFGTEWSDRRRPRQGDVATRGAAAAAGYNQVTRVHYRGGWVGLFARENQTKALERVVAELNASGRAVVAITTDRWSFFMRLGFALLAVVTLLIVVRHENVLVISAPMG